MFSRSHLHFTKIFSFITLCLEKKKKSVIKDKGEREKKKIKWQSLLYFHQKDKRGRLVFIYSNFGVSRSNYQFTKILSRSNPSKRTRRYAVYTSNICAYTTLVVVGTLSCSVGVKTTLLQLLSRGL